MTTVVGALAGEGLGPGEVLLTWARDEANREPAQLSLPKDSTLFSGTYLDLFIRKSRKY